MNGDEDVKIVEAWREYDPTEAERFGESAVRFLLAPEPSEKWLRRLMETSLAKELRLVVDRVTYRARDAARAKERGGVAISSISTSASSDNEARTAVAKLNEEMDRLRLVITLPLSSEEHNVEYIRAAIERLNDVLAMLAKDTLN